MRKMRKSKVRDSIVEAARKMPPLFHKIPEEKFDYRKSRTLWWLVKQPAVLEHIWNIVKQSGAVRYDERTGKWQGVDFESEDMNDD